MLNKTYNEQNYTSLQFNVNGEFNTGKLLHKILIGADGDYGIADGYTFFDPKTNKTFGTSYTVGNWILNNPNTWNSISMPDSAKEKLTQIKTQRYGIYLQDFVEFSKYFKVLAGIRYSNIENKDTFEKNYKTSTETTKDNTGNKEHAFSPKVGLIITPTENLSLIHI